MKVLLRTDTHVDLNVPCEGPKPKCTYSQVMAAISVSLGSMIVGFASGYTAPALVKMQEDNSTLTVTPEDESWIVSLMPLAGLLGGILGGPLIEHVGRRSTILGTALPFIISFLLIGFAQNVLMVKMGRALGGLCVGIASLCLPVYLGETVQPEVRGTLGLLPTALGNIGILVCYVAGKYLSWSNLAFMGACLPIPFTIGMCLIPETPRYLISKDKQKQARKALQWLRGPDCDITSELSEIERSHASTQKEAPRLSDLLARANLRPLGISVGLMVFQQFSGINAVIFYTVSIFRMAGSTVDDNLAAIIVGVVNFGSTFVATLLIDRLGRKVLLYVSGATMAATLTALATFFYIKPILGDELVALLGWLPLGCFALFVIGFSLGFGPIPWLMMGEVLPAKVRGTAASVATAVNWSCTFLVTKTFPLLVQVAGIHGAFALFGACCVAALFFVRFCVPETRGRSLEDIEKSLTGRRVRRMSSIANLKPLPFGA
ncbi:facilitated trehalose transporter Tret1 isoform X2 [Neocloeon triangulifer]|uniref:facilitated trehalose transporter Tret1 isoform X2 n=1 Tax=Neocloeon triangulifer TaxID=2078957 RepID=UPI00286F6CA5|nr:facilitated trehalose transporter Tret1 isoform X2 [Neocloeon triangulifer]